MNEVCTGRVVISRAGHDKGDAFIVMEILADGQLILCDGKRRTLQKPKRKKRMHVFVTPARWEELELRLSKKEQLLDSDIRKALAALGYANRPEEEGYIVETGRY